MNNSDLYYECPVCEALLKDSANFIIVGKEHHNKICTNCAWNYKSEFINENDM